MEAVGAQRAASGRRHDPFSITRSRAMLRVLVTYASRYGSTRAIAEVVAATLRAQGMEANARPIREVTDLLAYDAVVVGGAVYGGILHADATAFIERHRAELSVIPLACFVVGARFALRDEPEAARQREVVAAQVLARVSPLDLHCFAGCTTGLPRNIHAFARKMRSAR